MAAQRLPTRIAAAALWHARSVAWALLALGVAAFVLLPLAGKRCYLDEKALLVGGALPTVRQSGAVEACVADFQRLQQLQTGAAADPLAGAAAAAALAGLQLHRFNFSSPAAPASDGSSPQQQRRQQQAAPLQCSTLHGVVRAARGDGTEGFVLLLPMDGTEPQAAALTAAAGAAVATHLRRAAWLAKDAVLLFADAACGVEASAQAWLDAYNIGSDLFTFPRAGALQQALVLELRGSDNGAGGRSAAAGSAEIAVHGHGGQLPNLDLYYLIKRNLDLHTGLPVSLRASEVPLPPAAQRALAAVAGAAAALGPSAAAAAAHAAELQTLAAFAGQLASGRPTGAHAAFLSHQIDAATLTLRLHGIDQQPTIRQGAGRGSPAAQAQVAASAALAAAEMVLRTLNNLEERLHHSTALYVLFSADRFASIAAYLAPPGCLLLAALAQLVAASREAAGAPLAAWRSAWRQVGAAHAIGWAVSAGAAGLGSSGSNDAALQPGRGVLPLLPPLGWQLLWACAAGVAAAAGLPAMLAALGPEEGSSTADNAAEPPAPSRQRQLQLCSTAAGLAAAMLLGAHWLMGHWVRCFTFLLGSLPLYGLAARQPPSRLSKAAVLAAVAAIGGAAAAGHLPGWLWASLLPHLLNLALISL